MTNETYFHNIQIASGEWRGAGTTTRQLKEAIEDCAEGFSVAYGVPNHQCVKYCFQLAAHLAQDAKVFGAQNYVKMPNEKVIAFFSGWDIMQKFYGKPVLIRFDHAYWDNCPSKERQRLLNYVISHNARTIAKGAQV